MKYKLLYSYFYLLPIVYLASFGSYTPIIRGLLLCVPISALVGVKLNLGRQKKTYTILETIFLTLSLIYAIRNSHIDNYIFFTHLFFVFYSLSSASISIYIKTNMYKSFIYGLIGACVLAFLYMAFSGSFIRGGGYYGYDNTKTLINISNLNIPLGVSISLLFYVLGIRKIMTIKVRHLVLLSIFTIVALSILEKRGVIISIILILVLSRILKNSKYMIVFAVILLLFPFYELILYSSDFILPFFDLFSRKTDVDIDNNARIIRLFIAQEEFLKNLEWTNFFYYPYEIDFQTNYEGQRHFHNLILQLYYERGVLGVISFSLLICFSLSYQNENIPYLKITAFQLLFILIVGCNESVMMYRNLSEICLIVCTLYRLQFNIYKVKRCYLLR